MSVEQKNLAVLSIITKLELGGAQKVCLSLFKNLANKNCTTFLITSTEGPLVKEVKNNPNVFLLDSLNRSVGVKTIFKELKAFWSMVRIIKKIKKEHPDLIVHTHSTKAGILGRWAAFFAGAKHRIHTIHGYAFHRHQNLIRWTIIYGIELLTSFVTTHFVCVSHNDQTTGTKLFPFFRQKSSVIRAAVDEKNFFLPARKTTLKSNNLFIFGTVACFKPQKNLFDLLRAFKYAHQKNPHTRLELIGDGVLRQKIEKWIADHNLQEVITLHGWQDHVAPYLHQWHAFALSSLWEGLPCAVIEARLLKLPVIAYDTGGISEVIHHGVNGLIYPQKAWGLLAQGMLELSTNQQLYCKLSGSHDELSDFKLTSMIEQHHKLYTNL